MSKHKGGIFSQIEKYFTNAIYPYFSKGIKAQPNIHSTSLDEQIQYVRNLYKKSNMNHEQRHLESLLQHPDVKNPISRPIYDPIIASIAKARALFQPFYGKTITFNLDNLKRRMGFLSEAEGGNNKYPGYGGRTYNEDLARNYKIMAGVFGGIYTLIYLFGIPILKAYEYEGIRVQKEAERKRIPLEKVEILPFAEVIKNYGKYIGEYFSQDKIEEAQKEITPQIAVELEQTILDKVGHPKVEDKSKKRKVNRKYKSAL